MSCLPGFFNRALLLLTLLFLCQVGLANFKTVILSDTTHDVKLTEAMLQYFPDSTRKMTISSISSLKSSAFSPKPEGLKQKDARVDHWFKVQIENQSTTHRKWLFEVYSIYTDRLEFFIPDGHGGFLNDSSGSQHPFSLRPYQHINFVFDLPPQQGSYPIYIKVNSESGSGFGYYIRTQEFFTNRALNEYLFLGLYYGILLLTAIYNVLLYFGSRENVNLYYAVYVGFCVLLSLEGDGLGFQYLWPQSPGLNRYVVHLSYPFFLGSFFVYATSFLELRFRLKKVFFLTATITAVYIVLEAFEFLNAWFSNNLYLLPFFFVYGSAVYLLKIKKFKAARFFILGFSVVLVSIVITRLRWEGLIPSNLFTVYSFNFGIVFEVVVLSFAIADKFKITKTEKDAAQGRVIEALEENKVLQTKVNKELEEKVAERTLLLEKQKEELSDAKDRLESLTKDLNEMNAKLDYDNWQLNRRVNEQQSARLTAQNLTYEEFSTLFPTEESALKLLEDLKWSQGFACLKCANEKFTKKEKLARRCSKCSYLESVTKNTLFEALKFHLNKAFYLTYLVATDGDDLTVDEMAALLDLRRNTCWSFRKRVTRRKETLLQQEGITRVNNWQDLILNSP